MTRGSIISVCLGNDTAVRQHCEKGIIPTFRSRHSHNITEIVDSDVKTQTKNLMNRRILYVVMFLPGTMPVERSLLL